MLRRILIAFGVLVGLAVLGAVVAYTGFRDFRAEQTRRLESGSQIADTAKGPMEYALGGEGKHTFLFVHGTPGGYDQGANFAAVASERGYRVLRVSRPGYLRTPLSTGLQPADQADAFAALLDTLGLDKVIALGASGGGASAAEFAARHPDRCEALILLSAVSGPRPEDPSRRPSFISAMMRGSDVGGWLLYRGLHRNPVGALERALPDPEQRRRIEDDPRQLESFVNLLDSALVLPSRRSEGLLNDIRWSTQMPEVPLASIRVPTLAVHGDADTSVPLDNAKAVAEHVPGAELVVIEGGTHLVSLTHPAEVLTPMFQLVEHLDALQAGEDVAAAPAPVQGEGGEAPAPAPPGQPAPAAQ